MSMLKRLIADFLRRGRRLRSAPPSPGARPLRAPSAGPPVTPFFALFNKMYKEVPFDDPARRARLVDSLSATAAALQPNQPGSHAYLADDMLVWFRTLGFLADANFVHACLPYADDALIRARIWRVYTLCWAARSCLELPGAFIDVGCYDAKTVEIIMRYVDFASTRQTYYLYDLFDDPPAESRKALHGPQLFDQVRARMQPMGRVHVIPGMVPATFGTAMPKRIAFAQIDLNDAQAELACLEPVVDRMVPGALLVLDDYGFVRYRESHLREKEFFESIRQGVLELPTGQGLFLKR